MPSSTALCTWLWCSRYPTRPTVSAKIRLISRFVPALCGDLKGRGSAGFDPFEALLAFVLEVRYRSVETLLILIVYRPMSGIYLIEVVGFESV